MEEQITCKQKIYLIFLGPFLFTSFMSSLLLGPSTEITYSNNTHAFLTKCLYIIHFFHECAHFFNMVSYE